MVEVSTSILSIKEGEESEAFLKLEAAKTEDKDEEPLG